MKKLLTIEGRHNGYSYEQIKGTIKVGDLIDFLQEYDRDTEIMLRNDNGYTFGSIDRTSFIEWVIANDKIIYADQNIYECCNCGKVMGEDDLKFTDDGREVCKYCFSGNIRNYN